MCMEGTVVSSRDSPCPFRAQNLVMETDTEQIQKQIKHTNEKVILNLENIKRKGIRFQECI